MFVQVLDKWSTMLKNYLKVALRSILRNKISSLINIAGLTVGISCALLIFLYVYNEWTYEHHHEKGDQIHLLFCEYFLPDGVGSEIVSNIGSAVAPVMVKDYPEVVNAVRIIDFENELTEQAETAEQYFEEWHYADSTIFDLFNLPLLAGDPETALEKPRSLVISKKMANKYFGNLNVLGKELILVEDTLRTVYFITGVLDNLPDNTDIKFDFLSNLSTLRTVFGYNQTTWWNFGYTTFLELNKSTDVGAFDEKITRVSANYILDQEEGSGYRQEYHLQALKDMHLYGKARGEKSNRATNIYIFSVIGFFLLLIACINFMNLATARSMTRAREVGMRKVVGAFRLQLIGQFFGEALLMATGATILSIGLIGVLLPFFNNFVEKELSLDIFANPVLLIAIPLLILFVGLLSGSYPALALSAFNPVETLRGNFKTSSRGSFLRKALVVTQFAISIGLIASTFVIYQQLQFLKNKELGFEKDNVIVLPMKSRINSRKQFQVMEEKLKQIPEVKQTSLSSEVPGYQLNNNVVRKGWDENADWSDMRYLAVDPDFIDFYELELLEGRGFKEGFETDEAEAFLLNQTGMLRLGWKDPKEAIGKKLRWQNKRGVVIGILKDFNFMSAENPIEPFIVIMDPRREGYLSVKVAPGDYSLALQKIENVWNETLPNRAFDYSLMEDSFDRQYQAYEKFISLFTLFAVVAILIACLGLYGLAAFTTQTRTKEIGVRKTHGADIFSLVVLLTKDFSKLIIVAFLIAVPLAWYAMDNWLQDFAYQITIRPQIFLYAGLAALLIAWTTVSYHSVKAAMANPVEALKYE